MTIIGHFLITRGQGRMEMGISDGQHKICALAKSQIHLRQGHGAA